MRSPECIQREENVDIHSSVESNPEPVQERCFPEGALAATVSNHVAANADDAYRDAAGACADGDPELVSRERS